MKLLRFFIASWLLWFLPIQRTALAHVTFSGRHGVSIPALIAVRRNLDGFSYQMPSSIDYAFVSKLRQQHVDLVRLVTRPMPMLVGSDEARRRARDQVIATAQLFSSAGLSTIVDLHPWPPDNAVDQQNMICTSGGEKGLKDMLVALARDISKSISAEVALELLNEPKRCSPDNKLGWVSFQTSVVRSIRVVAPELPLIVTPAAGQLNDLIAFDVSPYLADKLIYFSFHFYDPFPFTTPGYYNTTPLPFPAPGNLISGGSLFSRLDRSAMNFQQSRDVFRYLTNRFDLVSLKQRFEILENWRITSKIPPDRIIMGEYGVVRSSGNLKDQQNVDLWLKAVTELARQKGIRSVFWLWPTKPNFYTVPQGGLLRKDIARSIGLLP